MLIPVFSHSTCMNHQYASELVVPYKTSNGVGTSFVSCSWYQLSNSVLLTAPEPVVGRGHASLLTVLDTWQSKMFTVWVQLQHRRLERGVVRGLAHPQEQLLDLISFQRPRLRTHKTESEPVRYSTHERHGESSSKETRARGKQHSRARNTHNTQETGYKTLSLSSSVNH